MSLKSKNSEEGMLDQWTTSLINAEAQPEIAAEMDKSGYDKPMIDEGNALLEQTKSVFKKHKKEDDEETDAFAAYKKSENQLNTTFKKQRRFAKLAFRKDPVMYDKLGISGRFPSTYINRNKKAKLFYEVLTTSTEAMAGVAKYKITPLAVSEGKAKIRDLQYARAKYLKEKGESEAATQEKDIALATMEDWMNEFYAVAKIAMEDKPQLLEALGITVKR